MNFLVWCFCVSFISKTIAVDKIWLADTNFNNPKNWNPHKIPCGNDVAILPTQTPALFVQVNMTIKEMFLPLNGELIFGQNIDIRFTDEVQPGCQNSGQDVDFEAIHPESWLNPNNWCISSNRSGACDPSQTVLDVERVPCTYDTVLFPRDHLYFVDLKDNFNVSLKSFKYQRTTFTSTSDLLQYFNSSDGKKIFQTSGGTSPITIDRGQRCRYSRGCPCGNDRPEMSSLICHFVMCQRARCQNVIKPAGACCFLCGVVFNITSGAGFSLEKFTNDIRNKFLPLDGSGDVSLATSITYDNWVQLVLTDPTGEKSLKLGKEIEKELLLDLQQGGHMYCIDAMSMTSGSPINPSAQQSQQSLKTSEITGIAVAVVGVFLIGLTIAIFLMYRGSGGKMTLPRLGNLPRLPRFVGRRSRPTANISPGVFTAPHVDPGFANPLYDRSSLDDEKVVFREMKVMGLVDDVATFDVSDKGFDNPMYGVQQTQSEKGDVSVTTTSGASLSLNIQHHPMDSSI